MSSSSPLAAWLVASWAAEASDLACGLVLLGIKFREVHNLWPAAVWVAEPLQDPVLLRAGSCQVHRIDTVAICVAVPGTLYGAHCFLEPDVDKFIVVGRLPFGVADPRVPICDPMLLGARHCQVHRPPPAAPWVAAARGPVSRAQGSCMRPSAPRSRTLSSSSPLAVWLIATWAAEASDPARGPVPPGTKPREAHNLRPAAVRVAEPPQDPVPPRAGSRQAHRPDAVATRVAEPRDLVRGPLPPGAGCRQVHRRWPAAARGSRPQGPRTRPNASWSQTLSSSSSLAGCLWGSRARRSCPALLEAGHRQVHCLWAASVWAAEMRGFRARPSASRCRTSSSSSSLAGRRLGSRAQGSCPRPSAPRSRTQRPSPLASRRPGRRDPMGLCTRPSASWSRTLSSSSSCGRLLLGAGVVKFIVHGRLPPV